MEDQKGNISVLIIGLVILGVISIGSFYLGLKSSAYKQNTNIYSLPSSSPDTILKSKNSIPFPVIRIKKQVDYSSFTQYKDKSGYIFYYPKNWFISTGGQQVQSWEPNTNVHPGPLIDNMAKWDVYFKSQNYSSLEEAITKVDPSVENWDQVEVSSTTKGWPVYFAIQNETQFTRGSYLIADILTPDKTIITWTGFTGTDNSNIETLKQIVESLDR